MMITPRRCSRKTLEILHNEKGQLEHVAAFIQRRVKKGYWGDEKMGRIANHKVHRSEIRKSLEERVIAT
jgi:hypothetical protein